MRHTHFHPVPNLRVKDAFRAKDKGINKYYFLPAAPAIAIPIHVARSVAAK
jgi:hypothetical protein